MTLWGESEQFLKNYFVLGVRLGEQSHTCWIIWSGYDVGSVFLGSNGVFTQEGLMEICPKNEVFFHNLKSILNFWFDSKQYLLKHTISIIYEFLSLKMGSFKSLMYFPMSSIHAEEPSLVFYELLSSAEEKLIWRKIFRVISLCSFGIRFHSTLTSLSSETFSFDSWSPIGICGH